MSGYLNPACMDNLSDLKTKSQRSSGLENNVFDLTIANSKNYEMYSVVIISYSAFNRDEFPSAMANLNNF